LDELVEVDIFKKAMDGKESFGFVDVEGFDDFWLALNNFLKDTEVVGVLEGDFSGELDLVGFGFGVEYLAVVDALLAWALFGLLGGFAEV
jgi:hypothetical protein